MCYNNSTVKERGTRKMFGTLSILEKFLTTITVGGGLVIATMVAERVLYRVSKRYRYFVKTGK